VVPSGAPGHVPPMARLRMTYISTCYLPSVESARAAWPPARDRAAPIGYRSPARRIVLDGFQQAVHAAIAAANIDVVVKERAAGGFPPAQHVGVHLLHARMPRHLAAELSRRSRLVVSQVDAHRIRGEHQPVRLSQIKIRR